MSQPRQVASRPSLLATPSSTTSLDPAPALLLRGPLTHAHSTALGCRKGKMWTASMTIQVLSSEASPSMSCNHRQTTVKTTGLSDCALLEMSVPHSAPFLMCQSVAAHPPESETRSQRTVSAHSCSIQSQGQADREEKLFSEQRNLNHRNPTGTKKK